MQERRQCVYTALATLFVVIIVFNNLVSQKFTYLNLYFYTVEVSIGVILYPFTFCISDLIAEFYGKSATQFCVKMTMVMNIFIASMIMFFDKLTAASWSRVSSEMFHTVFAHFGTLFIASMIACFISQYLDIYLYLWLKKITNNKLLWLRNNVSNLTALLVDTTIVVSIATFFKLVPTQNALKLIFNSYMYKVVATICMTPFFYLLVALLRQYLGLPTTKQPNLAFNVTSPIKNQI